HRDLTNTPTRGNSRRRNGDWTRRRTAPVLEQFSGAIDRRQRSDIADDDERENRRPDRVSMELDERAATDPFDRRDTACGWAAVWMGRTIQQLRQRLASANRRIVFILPKHRDAFGASLGEF